jgi:hypothetical protein
MAPSPKNHHCGECNFSTSRKFNLTRHYKRKHENNGQVWEHHPVHVLPTGRQQPVYQKHVQEQQTGEQHPIDAVHYQPVHAQQAWAQQQGDREVLYQQHDRKHAQVNNQQEQHPLDAVHYQPVQAQQAWGQQQGGRVRVLCQKHAQVNNQTQYKCYM